MQEWVIFVVLNNEVLTPSQSGFPSDFPLSVSWVRGEEFNQHHLSSSKLQSARDSILSVLCFMTLLFCPSPNPSFYRQNTVLPSSSGGRCSSEVGRGQEDVSQSLSLLSPAIIAGETLRTLRTLRTDCMVMTSETALVVLRRCWCCVAPPDQLLGWITLWLILWAVQSLYTVQSPPSTPHTGTSLNTYHGIILCHTSHCHTVTPSSLPVQLGRDC